MPTITGGFNTRDEHAKDRLMDAVLNDDNAKFILSITPLNSDIISASGVPSKVLELKSSNKIADRTLNDISGNIELE